MKDRIQVLHVVGQMNRGGTETLLMNMLRILDRDSFQFDFVEQTNRRCDYDDEIESLGSTIYRCPTISASNLSKYRAWWREFFKDHPEYLIVHGHSRGSAPIYLDEANKANRITILHCHSESYGKGVHGIIRFCWQVPLHWIAKHNLACSYDSGVSQFGRSGKFEVIKNGIISQNFSWNKEARTELREEMGLGDSLVIGNVARFDSPKNHLFLLDIFREIKALKSNAVMLLVGKGSREEEIRVKAAEYGILDSIVFAGLRSDANRFYQAMDVFVLPSLYEGLPLVLVEAQTSGLPCYVSDAVSKEAAVTDLVHYFPLSMPPKSWAEAIVNGVISEEKRCGRQLEIIQAGFDIQATAERLYAFYSNVIQQ